MNKDRSTLLRTLPAVSKLLDHPALRPLPHAEAAEAARKVLERSRRKILAGQRPDVAPDTLARQVLDAARNGRSLRSLINATGVIVHTNLGRAPLDEAIFERAKAIACGYSNLEYDTQKGKRGDRNRHATEALRTLLGCEAALVVNNNAAAVFLVLNTFAKDRGVLISRGELVEIGGTFRIPDVMAASGARMKEVGTTNKTYLRDYEAAIDDATAMVVKVHASNYRIEGFHGDVSMHELTRLAQRHGLIDYYDLGSLCPTPLPFGLDAKEPTLAQLRNRPASLMSFSGDKLFGAVQAGIVAGKKELIEKLGQNPLFRMMRVDKVTLALIEETARAWMAQAYAKIPVMRMISQDRSAIKARADAAAAAIAGAEAVETEATVGGGTLPTKTLPSYGVIIEGDPEELARRFRERGVVGRIEKGAFLLDMFTVRDDEVEKIVKIADDDAL